MTLYGKGILMLETIKRLSDKLISAEISIPGILEKISGKADTLKDMWGGVNEAIAPYVPAIAIAILFIVLSLAEAFVGKRCLGVQKVIVCFALGFIVGAVYIHPLLAPYVSKFFVLDVKIVAAVVGVIAALVCRPIYFCGYVGLIGYFAYFIMMNGVIFEFTKGSKLIAIIVAAAFITVALCFRKIVEIAGTSLLGGWLTALSIEHCVSVATGGKQLTDIMVGSEYVKAAVIAFIAIAGFVVQYRTRRRW